LVVVVVGAVLIGLAIRPHGARTISAPDAKFEAPAEWSHTSGSTGIVKDPSFPTATWEENFLRDPVDVILVAKLKGEIAVGPDDFHAHLEVIKAGMVEGLRQAGATLEAGPTETEFDGLPGLEVRIERPTPTGEEARSRLVLGFSGSDQYLIRCQFDENHEDEVLDACQHVIDTFHRT